MPYSLGPNGEILYDGQVVAGANQPLASYGQKKGPPPEAPGGDLQANTSQGARSVTPTPESDTGSTPYGSTGGQQQSQQPSDISQTIADLMARRRAQGGGAAKDYANWANQGQTISPAQQYADMSNWANAAQNNQMLNTGGVQGQPYVGPAGPGVTDRTYEGPTIAGGAAGAGGLSTTQMGGIASGIGAIGDIIAKGIAGSVGSWKMQPSHIPDPSQFTSTQQYHLQRKMII